MAFKITQDCIACGTCVDSCPAGAIIEKGENFTISADCTECSACLDACPVSAIAE
jgi:ferredoxin